MLYLVVIFEMFNYIRERYLHIYRIAYAKLGLVQPQDKIVDRFALTIYPYSLAHSRFPDCVYDVLGRCFGSNPRNIKWGFLLFIFRP
jgi:hypothetical protein